MTEHERRCPECGEAPEDCPGHKPGDPPHRETCQMCADLEEEGQ